MATEDITENLPGEARDAGLELFWHRSGGVGGSESVTLLNRDRQALFAWPYNANLGEVQDKVMEVLKEGRL